MGWQEIWRKAKMIDWLGAVSALVGAAKGKKNKVDSKYLYFKPRILSDDNYMRAVSGIKGVMTFLPFPGMQIAGPVLGLGQMGFKLWKRIALSKEFDQLQFPLANPNTLHLHFSFDPELKNNYQAYLDDWGDASIQKLQEVYNDLLFMTNPQILKAKYPNLSPTYLEKAAAKNHTILQGNIDQLEQEYLKVSHSPQIDHNIGKLFEYLRELFPALNDWALFNSDAFDEAVDIIDTVL